MEEKDHHQSNLPTWGLLRMEDKLWLLAFEFDFVKEEEMMTISLVNSLVGLCFLLLLHASSFG